MPKICTVNCPLCGNLMASSITKKGAPFFFCGICKIGFMVLANSGRNNLQKACQEVDIEELPEPTLKWYKKKIEAKE